MYFKVSIRRIILFLMFISWTSAAAQGTAGLNAYERDRLDSKVEVKSGFEFGAYAGKLLPNKIEDATEIMSLWGLRASFLTLSESAHIEISGTVGRSEGTDWKSGSLSLRFDRPIETLLSYVYFGADFTTYEPIDGSAKKRNTGGGHVGGGIMAFIADSLWFRLGMKFNIEPGTSLFINAGFVFRFEKSKVKLPNPEVNEEGLRESEALDKEQSLLFNLVNDQTLS